MPFNDIVGQDHAKKILARSLQSNCLSHAYIFHGPHGSGRKQMAVTLAQAVYCTKMENDACGECISCRTIEHHNHPEIHWIEPETSAIKIDQIRELQKQLSFRSSSSGKKIYVVNQAERLTVQAANSLLKFLEEPGSDIMAILITENVHALLPTIQSRAQWLSFMPLPLSALSDKLQQEGFSDKLIRAAVCLNASVESARTMMESDWFAETRNVMLQLVKESFVRYPAAIMMIQQKVLKAGVVEHLDILLELWMLWCKDMIHLLYNQEKQAVYIDQLDWMEKLKFSRDSSFWLEMMEEIIDSKKRLRMNANPQLTLERLIYKMQGESFCIQL